MYYNNEILIKINKNKKKFIFKIKKEILNFMYNKIYVMAL